MCTRPGFQKCEVNIRAVLATFYIGTGGRDISRVMSMMRVGGASSFERSFSQHSLNIYKIIRKVCDEIIYKALVGETIATIEQKHGYIWDESIRNETKRCLNAKKIKIYPKTYLMLPFHYLMTWDGKSATLEDCTILFRDTLS